MIDIPLYLYVLLFFVAVLYSSVGHGGASGYLALMALAGVSLNYSRPIALILNCAVSLIAFIQYARNGYFDKYLFIFLALASVPMAYLGSSLSIPELWYKKILGIILIIAALRFFFPVKENGNNSKAPWILLLLSGAGIGFLSGLIGIGGGILLTPLLLFAGWSNMKTAASVSALFIFVNSLSGLSAQVSKGIIFDNQMFGLAGIAISGGLLGSYLGAAKWNSLVLKRVLSVVLFIASVKLILE